MVGIEDDFVFRHFGDGHNHRRLTFAAIGLQLYADFGDNALGELAVINFDHTFREMRPVSFFGRHRHRFLSSHQLQSGDYGNADPSARRDLERFIDRLVPDDDLDFTHIHEGPDDMPSHIKMALTRTVEVIPFVDGKLCLGTWQGVFLWEHRERSHERSIVLSYQGIE